MGLVAALAAGLVLSLIGFLSCWKRGVPAAGFPRWLLSVMVAVMVLMPVLCSVVDTPDGRGSPTVEDYEDLVVSSAVWALLPGISFSVGGVALIVTALRKGKKVIDPSAVS